MMLEHVCVGTSEFREKINYEGTNSEISNKWADCASDEEFEGFDAVASTSQMIGKSEKGQPDTKTSTHLPLWSLTARVPLRRGTPVGERRRGRPCIESAISSSARSSGWVDGGRKLESRDPRSVLRASVSGRSVLTSLGRLQILVRPSPTSSMQVFSSETQVVGEGEYKTDTDRLRETSSECCTLAWQTIETFGETRRRACRLMQTGKTIQMPPLAFGSRRNCWTKQLRRCSLSLGARSA